MRDLCQIHNRKFSQCHWRCLIASFGGHVVFAWWPVRIYGAGGWFFKRRAWLRPVRLRRAIGFPKWYYTEVHDE